MGQALLFIASIAGLVALVVVPVWLVSGSRATALHACRRYVLIVGGLIGAGMALGGIIVLLELFMR